MDEVKIGKAFTNGKGTSIGVCFLCGNICDGKSLTAKVIVIQEGDSQVLILLSKEMICQ